MEKVQLPKTGLSGLKAHFKDDFIAGFSVSLIALPLCIGIALASGFPALAGLITAIIGGILASRIAGSFVTISGPAAGLIVISLGAIESLGGAGAEHGYAGYPHALGAILVAGLIVFLFGVLKFGKIGDFFPSSAVHGMLAAIGIIIIIKQIFDALGLKKPHGEILEQAAHIPNALSEVNKYALIVSLITLTILIVHQYLKIKIIKIIPAPMWVLIVVVPLAQYMGGDHLAFVDMPDKLFGEGGIQFPSFEKIATGAFWIAVTGFALVSGIESLLSAKAVDSLDPYKRNANLDKDLMAMGGASSVAAAIGGLPMISEIVRSSANINNGGKTQWANFYHGLLLLIYVLVLSQVIELIPVAALAAMLVFTGFRLAHPREFKHTAAIGKSELLVFLVTLIGVLATDLLIGIAIGIVVNYVLIISKGTKFNNLFSINLNESTQGELKLKNTLTFSNYLSLKKEIKKKLRDHKLVLNFQDVNFIDHTVVHHLESYRKQLKRENIMLEYRNLDHLIKVSDHEYAERRAGIQKVKVSTKLNQRQTELLGLAAANGWNYTMRETVNGGWDFYSMTMRKKILAIDNILISHYGKTTMYFADISVQEGAGTTTEYRQFTALKIQGAVQLPKFYMTEETFIDKLTNLMLDEDINFNDFPVFSKNYFLKGENSDEVRIVFTPNIIRFFESNLNLYLISNGEDLMLRSKQRIMSSEDMIKMEQLAKELIDLLSAQN